MKRSSCSDTVCMIVSARLSVGHHAGGFPVPGEHYRGRGRAARGEFRGEPHAATVGGHAARDAGG